MASFLDTLLNGVESTGDPTATNPKSSASGAFQMLDSTWRRLGNAGRAADAPLKVQRGQAEKLDEQDVAALQAYGIPVNEGTRYLAWQQGPAGARALLNSTNKTAIQALIDAGVSPARAHASVVNNGGTVNMSAGDFAKHVQGQYKRGGMPDTDTSQGGATDPFAGMMNNPIVKQILAASQPDATQTALAGDALKRGQAAEGQLDSSNAALDAIAKKRAALQSPGGIDPNKFAPPSEADLQKKELAQVSDDPGHATRVMRQYLPVLAMLGGAFVKNNVSASLKAANAAMAAAKSNDQGAVEKAHNEFVDQMTELKERVELANTVYQQNRDKYQDDVNGLIAAQSVEEAKDKNFLAQQALASGNLELYTKLKEGPIQALEKITPIITAAQTHQDALDARSHQILQDTDGTSYVYDMRSHSATTLTGQPYTPKGATKMASGQPRSAAALAATKYMQEHPDATAADLAKFAGSFKETGSADVAFGTGKQGQQVNSFNTAIAHLSTMRGLVAALQNGDTQAVNQLSQDVAQQFGGPAPTNFDAAKNIVGDEIVKAILGSGGALGDREKFDEAMSRVKSPAQLLGVMKQYDELMGGQLKSLGLQYKNTTGQDDFASKLLPETRRELGFDDGGAAGGGDKPHPKPGDVVKGYKFKGGDPSQQSSWEKVSG